MGRSELGSRTWHIKGYLPQSYKLPVSLVDGRRGSEGLLQNEFDGLIVAPSGQRRSSQRAGGAQTVDQELSSALVEGEREGAKFSPSSLDVRTRILRRLLISPSSRLLFMNVGDVPDTYHSPSCSLILQHVSTFFSPPSLLLLAPYTQPAWPIDAFFSSPPSFFPPFFLCPFLSLLTVLRDAAAGPDVLTLTLWIRVNIFSPG